jgi:NAD(P)-dependent dehydrogenase (short-subunit alcohol dehydrogenase family)
MNRGQVVVVTGASAGLGRAIACAWARRGARIALLARGADGLEAARREVEDLGGRGLVLPVDVADAEAVEAAAGCAEAELGPIDVWVNNAMVSVFAPIRDTAAEEFRQVTEVSYLGYVYGTLAALRRMAPRDRGVIVQVGSALAYRGIPLQSAYCAAKHAIEGFTDSLRCELLHDRSRVRVTMVQMPALNTPQFRWSRSRMPRKPQPVPPIFQPELGAQAVLLAVDQARSEVWFGFPTLVAIVANRLAPRLVDRYLAATGYEAQLTSEPVEPDRRDNLFAPLPGDAGTHGDFDARARRFSVQLWLNRHRGWLAAGAGLAALAALGARARGPARLRRAA